ncbi:MAG TPA: SAM-dependent methyltransferase [Acidimicrobiales bacterium]|nr:SAM-dependent methyltransferase [Acidimicrobiales bacterium]
MTGPAIDLVGAGPGDPRLVTRRAARLLAAADVVVVDRPSLDPVAALARPGAERVYVGRTSGGGRAWTTDAIADLLAERARAGRAVVRLKSGDPFVCSRGAEEMAALAERGVGCRVTPGVTAATAAPLAAGLPAGARVTIASGDRDPEAAPVPWEDLADPAASLVVLTGRAQQGEIARRLLAAGLPPDTPAAVVHAATRPDAEVVRTTLAGLGATRLPPPAAFVVGPDPEGGERAHP